LSGRHCSGERRGRVRDLNGYAGLIGGKSKLDDRAAFSGYWLRLNRVDFA